MKIEGSVNLFDDDTVLFFSAKTWDTVHEIAEREIGRVKNRLDRNLLRLKKIKLFIDILPQKNSQPLYSTLKIHDLNCKLSSQNIFCDCHTKLTSTEYL